MSIGAFVGALIGAVIGLVAVRYGIEVTAGMAIGAGIGLSVGLVVGTLTGLIAGYISWGTRCNLWQAMRTTLTASAAAGAIASFANVLGDVTVPIFGTAVATILGTLLGWSLVYPEARRETYLRPRRERKKRMTDQISAVGKPTSWVRDVTTTVAIGIALGGIGGCVGGSAVVFSGLLYAGFHVGNLVLIITSFLDQVALGAMVGGSVGSLLGILATITLRFVGLTRGIALAAVETGAATGAVASVGILAGIVLPEAAVAPIGAFISTSVGIYFGSICFKAKITRERRLKA